MHPILPFISYARGDYDYHFMIDKQSTQKKVIVRIDYMQTRQDKTLDVELLDLPSKIPEIKELSQKKSIRWLLDNEYKPVETQGKITFEKAPPILESIEIPDPFLEAYQNCKEKKWSALSSDMKLLQNHREGRSLLQEAIRKGDFKLAKDLIEQKIALYAVDFEGNTALHYAAQTGEISLIGLLWDQGIGIDKSNHLGQTPLHLAALSGKEKCVSTLLTNGASPTVVATWKNSHTSFKELSPLAFAILGGTEKTMTPFFTHYEKYPHQNFLIKSAEWGTILHLAIHFYRYDLLKYLFEKQKKWTTPLLEEQNQKGLTPFMLAAVLGEEGALFFLKEKGANVEATDFQGNRAMHHAALEKNIGAIKYLYSLGAQLSPMNDNGQNPSHLAEGHIAQMIINLDKHARIQEHTPPSFTFHPPENLIFQGGGPKGIAYVGVIEVLEKGNHLGSVKRIAGTSAGAINAVFMAMGYTAAEALGILSTTDLKKILLDHSFTKENLKERLNESFESVGSTVKTLYSVFESITSPLQLVKETFTKLWGTTGLCEGEGFRKWIDEKITEKTGIQECTFKELKKLIDNGKPFKHLYVYATCLGGEQTITCINSEEKKWEDIIISDAIRASMSIPGVFKAHTLHWKNEKGERHPRPDLGRFADGGMLYNFPLETFDKKRYQSTIPLSIEAGEYHQLNKRTLGFSLYTPSDQKFPSCPQIETVGDLLTSIMSLYFSSEEQLRYLTVYNKHRVIPISNAGVGTLDFSLSHDQKLDLVQEGRKGTEQFFKQNSSVTRSSQSLFLIPPFKDKKGVVSNVKQIHPDFVGRKELLGEIGRALLTSASRELPKVVICGSGGLGKSETAIAFANRHRDIFSLMHWIDASTDETYSQGYRELAKILEVACEEKDSLETIRERVCWKLEHQKNQKPFLLIFDNMEQLYPFPIWGDGAILVTSREKAVWKGEKCFTFDIQPFSEDESQELLCRILKCAPSNNTGLLAKQLDFYPLALNQAAHYIAETPSMTLEKYLQRLEKDLVLTLKNMPRDCRYSGSLFTSWKISEEKLQRNHPEALHFLRICAHLHPDTIALFFLKAWVKQCHKDKGEVELNFLVEKVLTTLTDYGLIRFNEETKNLSLHRVRQAMIRGSLTEESNFPGEVFSLLAVISEELSYKPSTEEWAIFKIWAPHARLALNENPQNNEAEIGIRNKLGAWEYTQGKFSQAQKLFTKALTLIDALHKKGTRDDDFLKAKAAALNGLGNVSYSLGNNDEAKEFYTQALNIREGLFGENHAGVATSLNNLGNVSYSLGNDAEAKELHTQALNIFKGLFGENHPDVAGSLNNLGVVSDSLGNDAEAKELHTQALNIRKGLFGENHSDVAGSLNKLGNVSYALGNYAEAKELYTQAFNIRKGLFGESHPDVARSLNKLGNVSYALGNYAEAKKLHTQALNIFKGFFGESHPDVAISLGNLGNVSYALGNYAEAKELYTQALNIWKGFFGESHPNVATSLGNLGNVSYALGNYAEAEEFFIQALNIRKGLFGENHADVATSLNKLGAVSYALGNYAEAKELYTQAFNIRKGLFGENHPCVTRSKNNLLKAIEALEENAKKKSEENNCIIS